MLHNGHWSLHLLAVFPITSSVVMFDWLAAVCPLVGSVSWLRSGAAGYRSLSLRSRLDVIWSWLELYKVPRIQEAGGKEDWRQGRARRKALPCQTHRTGERKGGGGAMLFVRFLGLIGRQRKIKQFSISPNPAGPRVFCRVPLLFGCFKVYFSPCFSLALLFFHPTS